MSISYIYVIGIFAHMRVCAVLFAQLYYNDETYIAWLRFTHPKRLIRIALKSTK